MASDHGPRNVGPSLSRWRRFLRRLRHLTRLNYIESFAPIVESRQGAGSGSLDDAATVGLPSVAMTDRPSMDEPVVQADLVPPGPPLDQADSGGAQPSTSDEDETVHKNGSFDGSPGLSQPGSGAAHVGHVSRETSDPLTNISDGGSNGKLGIRTGFGFVTGPGEAPRPASAAGGSDPTGVAGIPGPRAMAHSAENPIQEPTRALPAFEGSGGRNTIVSAAGHRGKGPEIDSVRQTREPEDPPLAQEAKRAVQILNPSGEIQMPRPPKTRVFCVSNQKGGVGKTTSVVNISVALALHGNRVLVIDLDPQGNASTGLDVPHHSAIPDVYDCLVTDTPMDQVVQQVSGIPNLWCVPATIDLAGAEIELVSMVARESRLLRALQNQAAHYDYVFIDCPPSLGLLTVNALVASQEVMIPIQCEYYALEGVQQLTNNIQLVKNHLNPNLDVTTVLLTMYDRRTRLADAVEQDVRAHFGDRVLTAVIPRNVRVSEAPSYGQSVMTYDPGSRGATSYFEAALEIATRGSRVGAV
jgi:chromosome partitioning protein